MKRTNTFRSGLAAAAFGMCAALAGCTNDFLLDDALSDESNTPSEKTFGAMPGLTMDW
jgi:hypothetical protein